MARGEDDVAKEFGGEQVTQISVAETVGQFAIIRTGKKSAPADDSERARGVYADGQSETMKPGGATIMCRLAGLVRAAESLAAIRIAEMHVRR